jgi:hypothetical protein
MNLRNEMMFLVHPGPSGRLCTGLKGPWIPTIFLPPVVYREKYNPDLGFFLRYGSIFKYYFFDRINRMNWIFSRFPKETVKIASIHFILLNP